MTRRKRDGITADQVRELLDYDPATGIFTWRYRPDELLRWNVRYAGAVAGSPHVRGYIRISVFHLHYWAHRLAWLHYYGEWPAQGIDHIDGNQTNNAIANLRAANQEQNSCNSKTLKNNKLGYRNVSFCKAMNRLVVRFTKGKGPTARTLYQAYFSTLEEAVADRNRMAVILQGEFARPTAPITTAIDIQPAVV